VSYDCPGCEWESGEDSDGDAMPTYIVHDGVQNAHCSECSTLLNQRENTTADLAGRFA